MCFLCDKVRNKFCDQKCKDDYISILNNIIDNYKQFNNSDKIYRMNLKELIDEAEAIEIKGGVMGVGQIE